MKPDARFDGAITRAEWIESSKGTPGLQVDLEIADGDLITHVWWVTPKTKEYFERDMAAFGVEADKLASGAFLQYDLPTLLVGKDVTFQTKSEEYEGKPRTKVAWVSARKAPSDQRGTAYSVAQMFGGKSDPVSESDDEDSIPF